MTCLDKKLVSLLSLKSKFLSGFTVATSNGSSCLVIPLLRQPLRMCVIVLSQMWVLYPVCKTQLTLRLEIVFYSGSVQNRVLGSDSHGQCTF